MSDTEPSPSPPEAVRESYPPEHHLLRDLPFEMEDTGPDTARAHLRVEPAVCTSGRLVVGPALVVADVLAGLLVGRVIAPDWMATAQLALHLVDPPSTGRVVIDAAVRRAGRTTIVVSAELWASDGSLDEHPPHPGLPEGGHAGRRAAGAAELTFVRLPRRDGNLDISDTPVRIGERVSMALPSSGLRRPYGDEIGVEVIDLGAGRTRMEVTPFVQNSFGAVNCLI